MRKAAFVLKGHGTHPQRDKHKPFSAIGSQAESTLEKRKIIHMALGEQNTQK